MYFREEGYEDEEFASPRATIKLTPDMVNVQFPTVDKDRSSDEKVPA